MVTIAILVGLGFIAFQIFSEPVELFDTLTGVQEQDALTTIAQVEFDPSVVTNNPKFKALQRYVNQVGVGSISRPNPFAPF